MSRLRVTGRQLIRTLQRAGFSVVRIKRSHYFLRHADGRVTVVPVHTSETIGPGLFKQILRDVELSREEFRDLL